MAEALEIVCIDDEPQILSLYENLLGKKNHPVKTFVSSLEARSYIERRIDSIGAIICDYKMPELDGITLLNEIFSKFGSLPFLLVSGYVDDKMLQDISDKISGHIAKPFDPNSFENAVRNLIVKTQSVNSEKIEIGIGFAEEALPKVTDLERLFLNCETDPLNKENLQAIYRILHTLKGTAASVGLTYLAIFCHSFEARLLPIRDGTENLNAGLISIFLSAQGLLMKYFSGLQQGQLPELTPFEELLSSTAAVPSIQGSTIHPNRINVSVTTLNNFLAGVGELVVLRNLMLQKLELSEKSIFGRHEEQRFLVKSLSEMQKIQSSMQEMASSLLKVPFSSLLPSLQRNVRELSTKLNKKVKMRTTGDETLFDHNTLQALSDSMLHLLRNSVDHGLEDSEGRALAGKPDDGSITIQIQDAQDSVSILISDDGKGIDPDRIRKKAIEKKLRSTEQIERMSPTQIISMIFEPGFSTAEHVTDVSGRGVGLDSVKKSIESIGGTVDVQSSLRSGTTFEIKLVKNKSLNIVKVVVVKSTQIKKLVIPADELVTIETGAKIIQGHRVLQSNGSTFIMHSGEFIQALNLSEISNQSLVLLLQQKDQKYCIIVDDVESAEDIILRDLDRYATTAGLFEQAAISGRHGVILFLNTKTIHKAIGQKHEQ